MKRLWYQALLVSSRDWNWSIRILVGRPELVMNLIKEEFYWEFDHGVITISTYIYIRCLFASVELLLNAIESKATIILQFSVMFSRENSFSNSFRIGNNSSNIIGHHSEFDVISRKT